MCGRYGFLEMAPKELWKAKVGFQKQKLIALHLAFQCHVALSYTHAECKPLPRRGTEGNRLGPGVPGGRPSPGVDQKCHHRPTRHKALPAPGSSAPGGGGTRRHLFLWKGVPRWEKVPLWKPETGGDGSQHCPDSSVSWLSSFPSLGLTAPLYLMILRCIFTFGV